MDDGLKQRVVGAIVLVGAAVIILPNVLKGPIEGPQLDPVKIPDRPAMQAVKPLIVLDSKRKNSLNGLIDSDRFALVAEPTDSDYDEAARQEAEDQQKSKDLLKPKEKVSNKTKSSDSTPVLADRSSQRHLEGVWTIQLASFKDSKNARDLVENLQNQGYNAYVEKITSSVVGDTGPVTRVYVGPEVKKDRALKIMNTLKDQLKLEDIMLIRFVP